MPSWEIKQPHQMTLDGEVTKLDVCLAHGKVRLVATDASSRLDVARVGTRGVTVSLDEGVLSIRHDMRARKWLGPLWWFAVGMHRYDAHVTVSVPPTATGSLTVVSGSVVASGLRRGCVVDVVSGSVRLMGLGGSVRAKTVSGSIEAVGIAGDLRLETVSGEISLADSSAERISAQTISGAVTCDLDNPDARDITVNTISGEITVRVPADADLDVKLNATGGRIRSAFPEISGVHSARGRLGSGAGRLRAQAVSGTVTLLSRPSERMDA
jgi:putative adhesin